MKRYHIIYLAAVLLTGVTSGCVEEELHVSAGREDGGIPVDFQAEVIPVSGLTKVQQGQFEFEEGDVIHVYATFSLPDNGTSSAYDCLEFRGGEWVSKESEDPNAPSSPMMWPWDAETATFSAYYLAHSSGILTSRTERLLDDLQTEADPLHAEVDGVPYGGAVRLQFSHLCARLTVNGLTEGETTFWLQKDGLQDAFSLVRDAEDNSLTFAFAEAGEELRPGGDHHVTGTGDGSGSATFYLAPGDYSDFRINYPYGLAYLTLTDITELENVEPNTAYVLNINPGSGNVDEADDDDRWEDPDDPSGDVPLTTDEINAFLEAIHDGERYVTPDGIPLLDIEDGDNNQKIIVLLRNVDFQKNTFTNASLPNSTVFDGKYHYIKNIYGSSLFNAVNGRVSNLGLVGGEITLSGAGNAGLLCPSAAASATMNNMRLKDISLDVTPPEDGSICNAGVLVGNSSGNILDISFGGRINVSVTGENVPGRVHAGGLVGQSSGSIRRVSLLSDEDAADVTVTCRCRFPTDETGSRYAEGDRYVGGLVGLTTGTVDDCSISATVTAAESQGVLMYTGGLAGMVRGAADSGASGSVTLTNSVADCNVTGGLAYSIDRTSNGEGRSYTGGLVGYAYYAASVADCISLGQVNGHDYRTDFTPYDNSFYAIGGAFGQIYACTSVSGVDARSSIVTDLAYDGSDRYYIGLFAGRSDVDYSSGNSCHNSGDYDFTGDVGNIDY